MNPITGQMEWNGTSIINTDDPANPKLVWHIPNESSANSRHVAVVYDYQHDGSGKDYLARSSQGADYYKFQIFDITSRDTDPSQIKLVSEITGTPRNSCGIGCGGPYISRAHKGQWSKELGLLLRRRPGTRISHRPHSDLGHERSCQPQVRGPAWLPGQKDGELGFEGFYVHHPIVDEENNRMYAGFRGAGDVAAWDISDITNPKLVWHVDTSPPGRGPHTVSPIVMTHCRTSRQMRCRERTP